MIRVVNRMPSVLVPNQENAPIEGYEVYMHSMVLAATSETVIEEAMDEPEWQTTGLGKSAAMIQRFSGSVTVDHPDDSEHIRIIFRDKDPKIALAGAKSLAEAFKDYYTGRETEIDQRRLDLMGQLETDYAKQLQDVDTKITDLASKTIADGQIDPAQKHKDAAEIESKLALDLNNMQLQVQIAKNLPHLAPEAATSRRMAGRRKIPDLKNMWYQEQGKLTDEIAQSKMEGVGPNVFAYRLMSQNLDAINQKIQQRVMDLQKNPPAAIQIPGALAANGQPADTLETLQVKEAALQEQYDKAVKNLVAASSDLTKLATENRLNDVLLQQAGGLQMNIQQLQDKKRGLELEKALSQRLEVVNWGELALLPEQNNKTKYSLVGAFGGGCLPVGLLVLLGFLNRRYRYADEMTRDLDPRGGATLLGVLPVLPPDMKDIERSADAAQCMHQIRVLLQIGGHSGTKAVLVTSASPGEGKTSLAAALGLSFSASGARTLLIDCDLVGQGLTRGFEAGGSRGLTEAMAGGAIESCVREIRPGLSLMPVGKARAVDACAVSPQLIRAVLASARQNYDMVLIDSGPLLGSVEASVLAPQVDEVVVAISRGQQPLLVKRTFQHLRSLGATIAGCVFNRAGNKDFASSYPGSSLRSVNPDEVKVEVERRPSRLGPLVESVDRFMPNAEAQAVQKS